MAADWTGLPFDVPDHAGGSDDRAPRGPLTVSELTAGLKGLVEEAFSGVSVEGQISNCKPAASGHVYFTLKDEFAQIRAVLFRSTARQVRFRVEDGLQVVVRGRLSVYEVRGEYQLICDALEPHGLGALQLAFDQLKRRLSAEGLFEAARKRPLPVLPRKIGIVTSKAGAALRDIIRVLTIRHPSAHIVVRDARVQGEGAADEIIRGLRAIVKVPGVEVVILARGGGSAEDLWAFNDEGLARAICACPVPVISGVGHEVDFTIADFVADLRAATPSNAAELVVERADLFRTRIDRAGERLRAATLHAVDRRQQRALRARARLDLWPARVVLRQRDCQEYLLRMRHGLAAGIVRRRQRFDLLRRRLEARDVRRVTAELRTRLVRASERLGRLAEMRRLRADARVGELAARLHALSPLAVLGRGYAVCWNDARTSIIRAASDVAPGERVRVTLAEGEIAARVEE